MNNKDIVSGVADVAYLAWENNGETDAYTVSALSNFYSEVNSISEEQAEAGLAALSEYGLIGEEQKKRVESPEEHEEIMMSTYMTGGSEELLDPGTGGALADASVAFQEIGELQRDMSAENESAESVNSRASEAVADISRNLGDATRDYDLDGQLDGI